jgi:hypothetical protein
MTRCVLCTSEDAVHGMERDAETAQRCHPCSRRTALALLGDTQPREAGEKRAARSGRYTRRGETRGLHQEN